MSRPPFIDIDGRKYAWSEIVARRKAQLAQAATPEQPVLFELKEDHRPHAERTAAGRYSQPSLFDSQPT